MPGTSQPSESCPSSTAANPEIALTPRAPIWWSNGIFFIATHLAALYGVLYASPVSVTPKRTLLLAVLLWQLSCFGITIGYHRLYSHRAFHATTGVRIVLAALGSMAFQGSIKWWFVHLHLAILGISFQDGYRSLRHRLHHRFTDDPVHDPYSATRGLLFSHMGWIFFKPSYERMESIDRQDLVKDSVVRYQHKHYIPIALFFGLVAPSLIGFAWGDMTGAFVWAGLVARVLTWHCTFLVNSLAHWDGLQNYSDEVSARGNLIMALWTCGEGNHNFHHAFPHDFRSGPAFLDWDPSKWIIQCLHRLGLANRLRCARDEDIEFAMRYMRQKQKHLEGGGKTHIKDFDALEPWQGPVWDHLQVERYVRKEPGSCMLVANGFLLDATTYMGEHPGGAALLRTYSLRTGEDFIWQDASWAFQNLNHHSQVARRRMRELMVAKMIPA